MTNEERVRALLVNLKQQTWDVEPQYRIEKEDAQALIETFSEKYPWFKNNCKAESK